LTIVSAVVVTADGWSLRVEHGIHVKEAHAQNRLSV